MPSSEVKARNTKVKVGEGVRCDRARAWWDRVLALSWCYLHPGMGGGNTRAEDAHRKPTQSHISPSILLYEDFLGEGGNRELGEVIALVQPLPDAVERGEGAEHEGEGGRELEGHVVAHREERFAQLSITARHFRDWCC